MQHKGKKDILGVLLKPQVFGKVEAVGVLLDAPSRETPFQGPPARLYGLRVGTSDGIHKILSNVMQMNSVCMYSMIVC